MERTNTFVIDDNPAIKRLADNCARLWNEVNFERRQAYIHYKRFKWYPKHLYKKYAPLIGSATAQQIINKNNEAWRSFLKLKKLEKLGKLPPQIKKVSMPRYWKWLGDKFTGDSRVKVVKTDPGKRTALARGIEIAKEDFVVVVESGTLVNKDTILELVKPFENPSVGGVVGDQRIYEPYRNMASFFSMVSEKIKYKITAPALSYFNQVTVLGRKCVAYRKSAVEPNIDSMENEYFVRSRCVSGDDGRFTSLLLMDGWKTKYQSTSYVETISPPNMIGLIRQRLRWFRNSARRTSRALVWEGYGFGRRLHWFRCFLHGLAAYL